jgi:Cytochrome P450
MNILNNFISPFVERAIQMSTAQIEGKEVLEKEEEQNFTHSLSLFTRDRKVLRDQLVSSLLAGRDTTACTLSWLFYELSYHPQVYSRLREEIIRTVGVDGKPTYEDLKGMKYLQWCLNESISPFLIFFSLKMSSPIISNRSIQCPGCITRHYPPSWWRSIGP